MTDNIDGANLRRLLDATARKEEVKTAKWMCERIIKQLSQINSPACKKLAISALPSRCNPKSY